MKDEAIVGVIKDLGSKLAALAEDFDTRASSLVRRQSADPEDALDEDALADRAREMMAQRRLRRHYLPAELFHEPAWDMLVALFVSHRDDQPMNIKSLVAMADAPVTTSQRWIEHLHKLKLIDRVIDPTDRRRVEVSLSHGGYEAVKAYLQAVAAR